MPPGTGDVQMGLARLLPRTSLLVVTTLRLRLNEWRNGQPIWRNGRSPGARSDREYEWLHLRTRRLTLCSGKAAVRRLPKRSMYRYSGCPIETSVSAGGDSGEPSFSGTGAAAASMQSIVDRIVTDVAPPVAVADELDGAQRRFLLRSTMLCG